MRYNLPKHEEIAVTCISIPEAIVHIFRGTSFLMFVLDWGIAFALYRVWRRIPVSQPRFFMGMLSLVFIGAGMTRVFSLLDVLFDGNALPFDGLARAFTLISSFCLMFLLFRRVNELAAYFQNIRKN